MRSPWKAGSISLRWDMCARLVEQQHRARAEQRPQDRVGLAGVQHARVAGEDLLDVVGVARASPSALVRRAQREGVAVAVAAALEPGTGRATQPSACSATRRPGSGRERHTTTLPARAGSRLEGGGAVGRAEAGRAVEAGAGGAEVRAAAGAVRCRW